MSNRSVVITGVGPVSAIGCGRKEFWSSLIAGRHGFGHITLCDTPRSPSKVGALDLLVNLSASVKSAPPFFHEFVLARLKEYVLQDGFVDESDARMIRSVIFGSGSSSGKLIDERERVWLRDLDNHAAKDKNHASWRMLKLEAGLDDSE